MDPRRQLIPLALALALHVGGCAALGADPEPPPRIAVAPLSAASGGPVVADAAPRSATERPYLEVVGPEASATLDPAGATRLRDAAPAPREARSLAGAAADPTPAPRGGSLAAAAPDAAPQPVGQSGPAAIASANAQALTASEADRFVGGVQVFAWSPGRVYEVWTAPLRVSTLTLGPGETVTAKAAGDTVRWQIGEAVSGTGAGTRTHVMIKPLERGLETNLVLTTTRRVYLIQLRSGAAAGFNAAVAWDLGALTGDATQTAEVAVGGSDGSIVPHASRTLVRAGAEVPGLSGTAIAYRVTPRGRAPAWTPLSVQSDGRRTVLRFAPGLSGTEAPALFAIGEDGRAETLTWRREGDLWIVDRVLERAELRLGDRRPRIVRIDRLPPDRS
ncbi:TrbG/VirB9 family P-type conjugative transfer protein [Brevundimonas bacteroides]|uniref:TrbG/VirB9 family P-type conjugative transfer protein n=1 Tax=Brevundimonas bacteroides TaxID=74311 RepID=UPI000557B32C|nr:TrbG/VirB9 family P-type conjugative transfer protein [Brevundimonas bacteroides]